VKVFRRSPCAPVTQRIKTRRRLSLLAACVGLVVIPLSWRGPSCGHDFDFHLQSWMEVVHHWQQGVVYPHWDASANYGAGEPRFVFYPPISWLLGALLGLVLPWSWTPLAFTTLSLAGMGTAFYYMAKEWMPRDNAALAACLYVLNPYTLFVAYERTAYGELLAGAWMPLLVLFALRRKSGWRPLALVVAALWLTNAPAAVMGSYALAVLALSAAVFERRSALVGRAAAAMALGLSLSAFYLVPAVYEQRWVEITRAITHGIRVEDSFLFEHTGSPFHDQVLRTASWIAVALLAAAVGGAVAAASRWRRRREGDELRRPLLLLGILITFLLFPISELLWRHAPELRFLQFPWRWLLVLALVACAFIGFALRNEIRTRRQMLLRVTAVLVLGAAALCLCWGYFWLPCDEDDNVAAQIATFHDAGFEGTDEYTAKPSDNGDIQQGLPPIRIVSGLDKDEADSTNGDNPDWNPNPAELRPAKIQVSRWQDERLTATVQTASPGFALLRLMDYPAWLVTVNGAANVSRPRRDDGLIAIPIPAGVTTIQVHYGVTRDEILGRILSAIAVLVLLAAWLWKHVYPPIRE
jgi:hypothetical protein